jgi:mannose-6-phosphate isomerase-like protein (cupin superfamily)
MGDAKRSRRPHDGCVRDVSRNAGRCHCTRRDNLRESSTCSTRTGSRRPWPLQRNDLRVIKVRGEFVWHKHEDTDDFFLVLRGHPTIQLRDRDVDLDPDEFFVVPGGVERCPRADGEAAVLLLSVRPPLRRNTGSPAPSVRYQIFAPRSSAHGSIRNPVLLKHPQRRPMECDPCHVRPAPRAIHLDPRAPRDLTKRRPGGPGVTVTGSSTEGVKRARARRGWRQPRPHR